MRQVSIVVQGGTLTTLYRDTFQLPDADLIRASRVEPRTSMEWYAHIMDGTCLGPYGTYGEAVAAEQNYVDLHLMELAAIVGQRK
jgi:hypothetical protein